MDHRVRHRRRAAAGIAAWVAPVVLVGLLAALPAPPAAAAGLPLGSPYRDGEVVRVTGQVTDAEGRPVAGVTVLLEVSRARFRLQRMGHEVGDTLTVPTVTDAAGAFSFDWRWDSYYNTFWLALALPVSATASGDGRPGYEIFHRVDATAPVEAANPAVVPITVADTGYIDWLRRFLDGRATEDERRVLAEMGRPEKIDELDAAGTREASWWYFAAGRVYHFAGGRLEQVAHFPPIAPAGDGG